MIHPAAFKKTTEKRLWKLLNISVGLATVMNFSMLGTVLTPHVALADQLPVSATVNGGITATVVPGDTVAVVFTVTTTNGVNPADNDWKSTQYQIGGGNWTCADTDNHGAAGTFTETFAITAPATVGTYDLNLRAYQSELCQDGNSLPLNLTAALVVTAPSPTANPALGQSCGLDIGLLIDRSGSIGEVQMDLFKTGLKSFVGAFSGTPTEFSVSQFDRIGATIPAATPYFSPDTATVNSRIDSITTSNNHTNWDDGLAKAASTFDPRPAKPNLIVIATDGSPNRYGNPANPSGIEWDDAYNLAVIRANKIKATGSRIIVVGIGEDPTDPATPAEKLEKMKGISGPIVALTPSEITVATDVIKTDDFSGIGPVLAGLANQLCGGKILVQKQYDTNGDGIADVLGNSANPLLGGWNFELSSTPNSGTTPMVPVNKITSNTGSLEFSVPNGTYSIQETTLKPNTKLVNAECQLGDAAVGTFSAATNTVSGLPMTTDNTISCTFLNAATFGSLKITKTVSGGTAKAEDFGFQLNGQGAYVYPAANANSVTFDGLTPGTYAVTETGPSGYSQTASTCSEVGVVAGEQAVCELTNTRDQGTVSLEKIVLGGAAKPQDWTFNVGGESAYTSGNAVTLPTGNYPLTESGPAGYALTSASGACALSANGIVLQVTKAGGTCTVTNTKERSTITLKKSGPSSAAAGANIAYTLAWTVAGEIPVTNAVLTDNLPANTTFVAATCGTTLGTCAMSAGPTNMSWNLGTRSPGESGLVTLTLKTANVIANGTVVVNLAGFDTAETDPVSDAVSTSVSSAPELSIVKSTNVASFINPGTVVEYTVKVMNSATASDSAKNVVITDTLPSGFTFAVDGSTTRQFAVGTIQPGQSASVSYLVNVSGTQVAGTFENSARAKGDNTTEVKTTVATEVRIPQILGAMTTPELTIKKVASVARAQPGDVVTFTITVKNIGDGSAQNVVVTDTLPTGFVFAVGSGRTRTWEIGSLESGRKRILNVDAKVSATAKDGIYQNNASVKSDELPTMRTSAKISIKAPKILGLTKTGTGPLDALILVTGVMLAALGVTGLRRLHPQSL